MKIPNEGEVWYNTETKYIYVLRDKLFRQLNLSPVSLLPNDIVRFAYLREHVLGLTCLFNIETWILLVEVSPNEYRWLPNISEAKTPKTDELWYCSKTGGYYVVDDNGIFVLVYLFISAQVSLKRGIDARSKRR